MFVQLLDRSGLAPWLQVEAEPAYVLEVGRDLLPGGKVKGLASKAAGLVDVALPDVRGGKGGHESRPGLDDLGEVFDQPESVTAAA